MCSDIPPSICYGLTQTPRNRDPLMSILCTTLRRERVIRSIRRRIACPEQDGFRLRAKWFGLRARTALLSPPTVTWGRCPGTLRNWRCSGIRRMAADSASAYQAKEYLITDAIRMNRSDGALVRLMTYMLPGESADAAQARVMKLGSQFLPMLDRYIPR